MSYEESLKRTLDKLDSLRGTALEARLDTKLVPLVGREFNVRRVYPIWTPGVISVQGNTKEFHDRVEQALEDGIIDDDEEARLRVTDLIVRSQRKTDRSTLWFTVEASGVINDDDITRSQQSANAIEKIYGQDTIPIVYGYGIHEDQKRLADELGRSGVPRPRGRLTTRQARQIRADSSSRDHPHRYLRNGRCPLTSTLTLYRLTLSICSAATAASMSSCSAMIL